MKPRPHGPSMDDRVRAADPRIAQDETADSAAWKLCWHGWTPPQVQRLLAAYPDAVPEAVGLILTLAKDAYPPFHQHVSGNDLEARLGKGEKVRIRLDFIAWQQALWHVDRGTHVRTRGPLIDELGRADAPRTPWAPLQVVTGARQIGLAAADVHLLADAGLTLVDTGPDPAAWLAANRARAELLAAMTGRRAPS